MSKFNLKTLLPPKDKEPGEFFAIGNRVYINETIVRRRSVAMFSDENEAAMYANQKNKQNKSAA